MMMFYPNVLQHLQQQHKKRTTHAATTPMMENKDVLFF